MIPDSLAVASDGALPSAEGEERRRRQVLPATYRLFYRKPVLVERAAGAIIYEPDGTPLVDAYNNVPVVGHSNSVVAERVSAQLQRANTHTRYLIPNVATYAERLLAHFEKPLNRVILTSSGSEANDLAVQIARVTTGHSGVIVTGHAYHGTTSALHALSPSLSRRWLTPETGLVDVPDSSVSAEEFARVFLAGVDHEISRLNESGSGVAALLIDSLLTSDGIHPFPLGLLAAAADRVRQAGGLWIADEVQSGFGRVGTHWWGYQRHGGTPDLVVLGKPMGNGLPIAGIVGNDAMLDAYGEQFRYFNTFGGNPVCVEAAMGVLDEIERLSLLDRTATLGAQMLSELTETIRDAGVPFHVRGAGLMIAVDTGTFRAAQLLAELLRERGVLVGTSGVHGEVLKIRPPLVIHESDCRKVTAAVESAIHDPELRRHLMTHSTEEGSE